MKEIIRALRLDQAAKNLPIFLPLLFGKKLLAIPELLTVIAGFFIFPLAAGAAYLFNDIVDVDRDRQHPVKCARPLPSGRMSAAAAWISSAVLAVLSLGLSFALNRLFGAMVALYLTGNILYSLLLKKIVIVDVFAIGGFFLIRLACGSVLSGVVLSHWIILVTLLLSLFLGFNKRRQEIAAAGSNPTSCRLVLANYSPYFIDQIISVLTSSIVVVYMLYTVDERTVSLFGDRRMVLTIPFVYYGIFRYLYLVHKKNFGGDPSHALLTDRPMLVNLIVWAAVCCTLIYSPR